ncbi:hypothetical protein VTN77DRAFT_3716 [Rasamsonia byssochlamydoides]|uniref:uncharacterized protein n=1 Tax=Rasamsonia byssochlamydoides TaxID=89139 RepID=UPI0037447385
MAFVIAGEILWHDGEKEMHNLLRVPERENPSVPCLSPGAGHLLAKAPLLALGAIDQHGRPWSTIWGGEEGFARPIAQSIIGIRALVDRVYDPVLDILLGKSSDGEVVKAEGQRKMVSGLAFDLEHRKRVKLFGKMVAGSLAESDNEQTSKDLGRGQVQLVVKIEESLGNCPKYMNKKHIVPALPEPKLISDSPQLPQLAIDLLDCADCFFLSSSHQDVDMDTNIRGGSPGFVRVLSNDPSGAVLVYPEYSGNRLYQTLGNLRTNPRAGYIFPDFQTGDALYLTGRTEILVGKDADAILPRSNLAVKVTVATARFVEKGLSFRGIPGGPSPYNPPVRYLRTEKEAPAAQGSDQLSVTVTLVKKDVLTPTINRFRFKISDPKRIGKWTPGQYAIFSFKDDLDMGYSHMRDDDPTSINDDYIRTFTVSSYPGSKDLPDDEFEVTVRKHGSVTAHLFRSSDRAGVEVSLRGFGGSFQIEDSSSAKSDVIIPFVAGGIGITPVIAQLPGIDISRLRLFWSVSVRDVGLVQDTFRRFPRLLRSTTLFVTQSAKETDPDILQKLVDASGAVVYRRRLEAKDLDIPSAETWYLCAGTALKAAVLIWLAGKKVIYEDFTY